jgi:heat shock protein HslJ
MTASKIMQVLALGVALIAAGACTATVGRDSEPGGPPTSSSAVEKGDAKSLEAVERNWSLVAIDGDPVAVSAERSRPSLAFDSKAGRVSGMAGVNRFGGPYVIGPGTLKLGPLMATKMAGSPELNELETRFLRTLERATAWRINGSELELLNGEQILARFTPRS